MDQDRREILFGGVTALAFAGATAAEARDKHAQGHHAKHGGHDGKHAAAATLSGPYVDLATPRGNMLTFARLVGDLDLGKQKAGWYNGYVSGVRPGEAVRDLFGFAGFGMARLLPHESGVGYRKVLREVGIYYDLKTQEPLEEYLNPYTNERVKVVHVANDPFNVQVQEYFEAPPNYGGLNANAPPKIPFILPWRQQGKFVTLERHIHLFYKNALQPDKWPRESAGTMARVSEFFTYFVELADIQNPKLTKLPFHGTWSRITPWLPWMLMGQADGHCQYMTYQGGGDEVADVMPRKVMDYIEKKYPLYLNAPDKWVEPSLSSIERYALEQKPAPVKVP
ncbi:MAG: DUF1838 family protein [Steroidobacteraceae bacterium]